MHIKLPSLSSYASLTVPLRPIHWRRGLSTSPNTPSALEALTTIQSVLLPFVREVVQHFELVYDIHHLEVAGDDEWEHIILPAFVSKRYDVNQLMLAAGFTVQSDKREFATQDGLREALLGGANFNKKWH